MRTGLPDTVELLPDAHGHPRSAHDGGARAPGWHESPADAVTLFQDALRIALKRLAEISSR